MKVLNTTAFHDSNVLRCELCFHPLDAWTREQWALAMMGEVGEVLNAAKKVWRGDCSYMALCDELGDVYTYLDLLCASMIGLPPQVRNGQLPGMIEESAEMKAVSEGIRLRRFVDCSHAVMRAAFDGDEFAIVWGGRAMVSSMLSLATHYGIPLAVAIEAKFNAVSERVGSAIRVQLQEV